MANKERSSRNPTHGGRENEPQPTTGDLSRCVADPANNPRWLDSANGGLARPPTDNGEGGQLETSDVPQETSIMRNALAHRTEEIREATRRLRKQSATLRRRAAEIDRLRQAMMKLEAENARLSERHQSELEAKQAELSNLLAAYDQFEQESDTLLDELSQKNERLRAACKEQNKLSVL